AAGLLRRLLRRLGAHVIKRGNRIANVFEVHGDIGAHAPGSDDADAIRATHCLPPGCRTARRIREECLRVAVCAVRSLYSTDRAAHPHRFAPPSPSETSTARAIPSSACSA